MRYKQYLNRSCKEKDLNTFRDLKIGLVDNSTQYKDLVNKIQKNYKIEEDISKLIEILNKDLSYRFRSKYKLDFYLYDSIDVNDIKLNKNKKLKKVLKEKLFEINDIFSKSKLDLERKLKEK
jgi:hypothetical protein